MEYGITTQYNRISALGKQAYTRARKFFSGPCMKLIPMSFIQDRRFDVRFKNGEDSLFMFLISDRFKYVDFTDKSAVYYRRYREGSAIMKKRSRCSIIINQFRMIEQYTRMYMSSPCKYRSDFYVTRILAAIKSMFE